MWCGAVCAETRVELRAGALPPKGTAIAVTPDGVVFAAGGASALDGPQSLVRWDRVLSIEGDLAQPAAAYAEVARLAWRARTRLERGDMVSAEPLFERLFAETRARPGRMRVLAAEGLTRCRIARGAMVSAVDSWLIWLDEDPFGRSAELDAASFADAASGLAPNLPPMFVSSSAVEAVSASRPSAERVRATQISWWYRHAMRFEAGVTASGDPPAASSDWAVELVADIVRARTGTPEERQRARSRLEDRLERPGADGSPVAGWVRAWLHAGIGRSLIIESDSGAQLDGVISLLTAASGYGETLPQLAALSLAEASVTLHKLGRIDEASRVRSRLRARYQGFAVLGWPPLNAWADDGTGADGFLSSRLSTGHAGTGQPDVVPARTDRLVAIEQVDTDE